MVGGGGVGFGSPGSDVAGYVIYVTCERGRNLVLAKLKTHAKALLRSIDETSRSQRTTIFDWVNTRDLLHLD